MIFLQKNNFATEMLLLIYFIVMLLGIFQMYSNY